MTDIVKDVEALAKAGLDMRDRLILLLGAAVLLIVAGIGLAHHFEQRGRTLERAGWVQKEAEERTADLALTRKHEAEMQALRDYQLIIERKTSEVHQKELDHLVAERDTARRRADAAGGLRIPAPTCSAGVPVAGTEAAGTGGRDEAGPATVALPQPLQDSLWALVNQSDEVSAQLRACQSWIRSNGFYSNEPADSVPLLDRMIAAPNLSTEATP